MIFAEIAELDSAFQSGTHFLYIVLETAQRRKPAVINRLPFTEHAGPSHASYATVSHEAAGNDALAKVEHLLHFGVSDDGFPVFGLEQTSHRFLHLIEQLINDAVKFDLDSFAFCSGNGHVLHLHIETDHYSIRSARQ